MFVLYKILYLFYKALLIYYQLSCSNIVVVDIKVFTLLLSKGNSIVHYYLTNK